MIPGEIFPVDGSLTLNENATALTLVIANTGDCPVQVGRHNHFAEANPALDFGRGITGMFCHLAMVLAIR